MEQTLAEIASLLDRFGEPTWAAVVRERQAVCAAATDARGRSDAARSILRLLQGGMASFSDVVLQPNGHVVPDQATLDRLRKRLFDEALAEV